MSKILGGDLIFSKSLEKMMNCFPCFTSQRSKKSHVRNENGAGVPHKASKSSAKDKGDKREYIDAQIFTFRELATATKNFRQECLLGEGGFGRVYKGTIKASGKVVAVKQLDRHNLHDNKEFMAEVLTLSLLHHPNLVNLIGYCADGDQRLLVFEYMPGGNLEEHILDMGPEKNPLDWFTRIKIAFGIATGLEYLHETANPPIIYRDLKSANVLLDDDLNPKLSDFGVTIYGQDGDKVHVSSRVMGTYGYSAPEYTRSGELTLKSDIYSYGVVLLELITGRRAIDTTRPNEEQNLVSWAQPFFRDPKKFPDIADPLLNRHFPEKDLNQLVAIAAMCLQDEASARPLISDVVTTLSFLSTTPNECLPASLPAPPPQAGENSADSEEDRESESSGDEDSESSESEESESSDYEDVKSRDECYGSSVTTEAKEWQSSRKSSVGGSDEEDESVSSRQKSSTGSRSDNGSVSSSKSRASTNSKASSVSSHNSSIGSNRPRSIRKASNVSVSLKGDESLGRSSTKSSRNGSFSLSRRRSRAASRSGNLTLSRDNSNMSQRISVCLDHSYSIGSQDGFVSLHNLSSRESLDGSEHSS